MLKLIVVIGATGGQGGGVVSRFSKDPAWKVRGVTRNLSSDKAKVLVAKGIEMVQADTNDEESLVRAFQGATAIFAFTDYYDHFFEHGAAASIKMEAAQGINLAKAAAKISTLERYIWSTLPLTSALSQGKAIVPHFEGKGSVDVYIKEHLPELFAKTTFAIFTIFAANMHLYPIFRPIYIVSSSTWKLISLSSLFVNRYLGEC